MQLADLLRATDATAALMLGGDVEVRGLAADSRLVRPGYLFAALSGSKADGRAHIADATSRGAAAILIGDGNDLEAVQRLRGTATVVRAANPRRALARMAAHFYGRQPDTIAAVTGTNGKTSVVTFTRQIWASLGHRAASIGTLGLEASVPLPADAGLAALTTPDAVTLHEALARLCDHAISHVAMEASSHGLDQYRLDGVRLAAAAFTNLTRDHLDYHRDFGAYRRAKKRLFAELLPSGGIAVLNADSGEFPRLSEIARRRSLAVVTYGLAAGDVHAVDMAPNEDGWRLTISVHGIRHAVALPLLGRFQVANALAALALVVATGGNTARAVDALAHLQGAPGRMERVARATSGAAVYVDYAHTPDALETALTALRAHCRGRLIAVFGCGGDRDPGKRPQMGAVAERLADVAYVTDDNPRSEDAAAIRRAILAAAPHGREYGDRRAAIAAALTGAAADDVVIIAGKGHERGQIVGDTILPFDDREEARAAADATRMAS